MASDLKHSSGEVQVGPYRYTHNRFLLVLALCALLMHIVSGMVGIPAEPGMSLIGRLATPQMVWALLLLPVCGLGGFFLNRSGHRDTALSCALIASGFLLGAGVYTYAIG
ncbi:hypothetical protein H8F21_14635 [Pseudomonas sp. P66]|uniref:MFS transporter n=1 Tax=Pseudomonas arcuscaelestis TaxID=2710591 RepID=A0ABS2BYW1_9PSED|nr:hypothetical protein [Pseudomonas arcuscaelestis]MBM5458802.1 hypothetical protein [Pseudomonas arcuscaelestis]